MFDADAVGYNARNAYILAYLSSAVYPDGLAKIEGIDTDSTDKRVADYLIALNRNKQGSDTNFFETRFRDELAYLFTGASFRFFAPPRNPDGYDPEAMVIDTPKAIIVVFRGTDRVGTAKPDSPEW